MSPPDQWQPSSSPELWLIGSIPLQNATQTYFHARGERAGLPLQLAGLTSVLLETGTVGLRLLGGIA